MDVSTQNLGMKERGPARLKFSLFAEAHLKVGLADNIPERHWPSESGAMVRPAPWSGKNGKRLGILLAAADAAFTTSLRWTFALMPQAEVVGVAANGIETLRLVGELRPDLALLDLYLPGIDGWQAAALIREFHPAARVIIIGSDDTDDVRNICLNHCADGFVARRNYYQELPREIGRVLFGTPAVGNGRTVR